MSHHGDNLNSNPGESDSDPLIDSLLDERLGGKTPPDLSKQILARLENENGSPQRALISTRRTSHARQYKSVRSKGWASGAIVATALATMAGVLGLIAWNFFPANDPIANVDQSVAESPNVLNEDSHSAKELRGKSIAPQFAVESSGDPVGAEFDTSNSIAASESIDGVSGNDVVVPPIRYFDDSKYDRAADSLSQERILAFLSGEFQRLWEQKEIEPAPVATDEQWLVRVFDRMIGRLPNDEETALFVRSRSENKRGGNCE